MLLEHLLFQFHEVHNFCHRNNGKTPQVRIDDERLRIGVADNSHAGLASGKSFEIWFELGAKIRVFEVVNGACELLFVLIISGHTASTRAEV